ncbi:hypothetical protein FRB91_009580 [Serendipita sp. 411]|nr:hypothetical protein FRC16_004239 [Serendipita sp. 398]KAG8807149.1 hypothetical protein FRC19_006837 [Serendipita sp. 401]KAG8835200.1 hypothetical protein FRC20_007311 [Serendipita sp. 405]KAG8836978.1 hypothetical protein FRC18_010343 [Serendipita sp. 400]KAG8858612.1 hypothetical protein FRB91_009580 [Serendipita sp. 411]
MASRLARFVQRLGRTGEYVQREMGKTRQVLDPGSVPKTKLLHRFRHGQDVDNWVHGSDASYGGLSTSHLDLAFDGRGMRLHGNLTLKVKAEVEGMYRGGFVGIKSRPKLSLFGTIKENLSMYDYLGIRAQVGPPPNIRDAWYLNIRTSNMGPTHIWQHRLFFRDRKGEFEDIVLPLKDFGFTASGNMVPTEDEMERESIEMIGISLLGGNAGLQGPFDIVIDEIWATVDPALSPRRDN